MFTRVQHALKRVTGRHVQLTADVYDDLKAWRELVRSLARRPTHLRKLQHFPLHGLVLLMHWVTEWEGYANTQRASTLF